MTDVTDNLLFPGARRRSERRRARKARPVRFALVASAGAIIVGLAAGFVGFARGIADALVPGDPHAEGIVVLTGGTARIDGALELLVDGRAKRLLISGVNPAVTRETLADAVGGRFALVLECCVDLDHKARDTIENAAETRRWADERGFTSLIVVTSDYHMPRSLAELGDAMPDARLIAYPVNNPELHIADWWHDLEAFGLLAREYGKYLLAEARQLLPSGHARAGGH